jgi:hypothetical protein
LKHFCIRYKRNKKNRKGKEEKKIKIEKGLGGNLSAQKMKQPTAREAETRTGTLFPLPPSLPCRPHSSGHVSVFLLQLKSRPSRRYSPG